MGAVAGAPALLEGDSCLKEDHLMSVSAT